MQKNPAAQQRNTLQTCLRGLHLHRVPRMPPVVEPRNLFFGLELRFLLRPRSAGCGSGGLMRSDSALSWMSRTYWNNDWLRNNALVGMSCSSRSLSSSFWSLNAASNCVTDGTYL